MKKQNYILEVEVNEEISYKHDPIRIENVSENSAIAEACSIIKKISKNFLLPGSVRVMVVNEDNGESIPVQSESWS
jgi:hypothetical protein|tara:strand:- start:1178 stop:1405 length:228 start_codon:yes stop_codon:yes gene_type:complete